MTLNNPLGILSLKMCGIGVEVIYSTADDGKAIDVIVEAIVWSRTWTWQFQS